MADERLSVAEFEAMVNEIKGDCDKCKMDCRNRLQILDSQIESFRALEQEYRSTLNEMSEVIIQLRALYQINMRVLNIVNAPDKAGEKTNETNFVTRFSQ
jgi:hypothetical protein